ncbi:MAG: hypothetical protein RR742_23890 [Citrobacter sp.]|uniref:hypothetical protein n=1 Tax=Citrobacter sp. TaxID=1896336 RepID=UPI002FC9EE0A
MSINQEMWDVQFPQLRVRTGFHTREVYGRIKDIADRLRDIGSPVFSVVDWNTFAHIPLEQHLKKDSMSPLFGVEIPILTYDAEGELTPFKPKAWILAKDLKAFYNASTKSAKSGGLTPDEFGELQGVLRFPGGALHLLDCDQYDYIDINPASVVQAFAGVQTARETGWPVVITSFNDMPKIEDASNAYAWEVRDSVGLRTLELPSVMWDKALKYVMSEEEFDDAIVNTIGVAAQLKGQTLNRAPIIHLDGDLMTLAREGQEYRLKMGQIKEWTKEYEDRFILEIEMIQQKQFDSYFLVVADLIAYAKQHMLVGPGRGSSAGSLICYLIGITEIDPIPYDLLFFRFIDIGRSDLPDIDIDFADSKRYMVFDYLKEKYGEVNVSKMGNISTLKAASVMAQVGKKFNIPFGETANVKTAIIEYSSADERYGKGLEDTLHKTSPGISFMERYPEASECMGDLELHPSHYGVHAAGILVCNEPIQDFCTVNAEGVAQLDKHGAEYLNLLKIDALGLRTLGIIDDTGCVTADELYSLDYNDPLVLDVLNSGRVSGIFQFEGDAVRSVTRSVDVDSFAKIDHLTALARPGPLGSGMANLYIERASGREPVSYEIPQLEPYLKDTFGVFLYQEQIMGVVKDIGCFDWEKTSAIRKGMAKSKGEEFFNSMIGDFVKGAVSNGIKEEDARRVWGEMVAFGAWGFNKAHSCSYAAVTYWTCYMKAYHRLEFAAACLRAAKDDTQTISILRELSREGIPYVALDVDHSEMNWKAVDGKVVGGIMNAKGYGPVTATRYIDKRNAGLLTEKDKEKLLKAEWKFSDLYEAHTKWGHFYERPELVGVSSGNPIVNMADVADRDNCLVIAKLTKKVVSDMNEAVRIKKRGGKRINGQSIFLDMFLVDDSIDSALRFRIKHEKYLQMGLEIAETAPLGSWWLIKAWKLPEIDMFIIKNIKRIDQEYDINPAGFKPEPISEVRYESGNPYPMGDWDKGGA